MAHMMCNCGNRLSNTLFPNTMEGEITGLYECKGRNVWHCEACGRLWIDTLPEMLSYVPESGKIEHLFGIGTGEEYTKYYQKIFDNHFDDIQKINRFDRDTEEIEFLRILSNLINRFKTSEVVLQIDERIKELKKR